MRGMVEGDGAHRAPAAVSRGSHAPSAGFTATSPVKDGGGSS